MGLGLVGLGWGNLGARLDVMEWRRARIGVPNQGCVGGGVNWRMAFVVTFCASASARPKALQTRTISVGATKKKPSRVPTEKSLNKSGKLIYSNMFGVPYLSS